MKRIISLLLITLGVGLIFVPLSRTTNENISKHVTPLESMAPEPIVAREISYEPNPIDQAISEMQAKMKEVDLISDKMEWYVSYKAVIEDYSDILDAPETIYDYFTDEEIFLMQRVVETECYDCDFDSKVNVSCVVLNRIMDENGSFGDTVEKVITSPNQFAYGRKVITESTILALEYAFQIEDTTDGCVAFRSDKKVSKWGSWEYVLTDEAGHHFYK